MIRVSCVLRESLIASMVKPRRAVAWLAVQDNLLTTMESLNVQIVAQVRTRIPEAKTLVSNVHLGDLQRSLETTIRMIAEIVHVDILPFRKGARAVQNVIQVSIWMFLVVIHARNASAGNLTKTLVKTIVQVANTVSQGNSPLVKAMRIARCAILANLSLEKEILCV